MGTRVLVFEPELSRISQWNCRTPEQSDYKQGLLFVRCAPRCGTSSEMLLPSPLGEIRVHAETDELFVSASFALVRCRTFAGGSGG